MIRLSPTNLDRWFSLGCPAAWDFAYRYSMVEPNPYAEFGTKVHAAIESGDSLEDDKVAQAAEKLLGAARMLGLRDIEAQLPLVELKQEWTIAPGITFVRKIDRIMQEPNGTTVIVDWKTHAGYGWKSFSAADTDDLVVSYTPQTMGTQTSGYFLEPPKKELAKIGFARWPKAMYYLVGPARGPAQFYRVERTKHADQNFQALLKLAVAAIKGKQFPKNYGKHCHDCDFKDLCFKLPGYKDKYDKYR